jgi:3-phosphoshikimate 1-carboxyvinyltransferase
MDRIVDPMQAMGVTIESTLGCAPLNIGLSNYPLHPIEYRLPVASAQVKSCLLITALVAAGPSTFIEPGPSRDHTERMLAAMGAKISRQKFLLDENSEQASHFYYQTRIEPPGDGHLSPLTTRLAGDISSAAFFIVASLITPGSEIVIRDVLLNPTRSGLFDALHAMGADLQVTVKGASSGEPIGTVTARYSNLIGISVSGEQVIRMIDEFPIFAVAAAHAQGTTIVCDAEELRYKETDRISLLCQQLQMLGVKAEILPDGFRIQGSQPLAGGTVSSCGDHRLAMAFTISGLAASSPVTVSEAEYIAESFPQFIPILSALGARVHVVD